jgi:hypothetical protein
MGFSYEGYYKISGAELGSAPLVAPDWIRTSTPFGTGPQPAAYAYSATGARALLYSHHVTCQHLQINNSLAIIVAPD